MAIKKIERASKYLENEFGPLYFSDLLKAHRLGEEISQEKLASILKVSKQKICDYEKGRRLPSMDAVVKWAIKLNEPHEVWVKAYIQQQVNAANLDLQVKIRRT